MLISYTLNIEDQTFYLIHLSKECLSFSLNQISLILLNYSSVIQKSKYSLCKTAYTLKNDQIIRLIKIPYV